MACSHDVGTQEIYPRWFGWSGWSLQAQEIQKDGGPIDHHGSPGSASDTTITFVGFTSLAFNTFNAFHNGWWLEDISLPKRRMVREVFISKLASSGMVAYYLFYFLPQLLNAISQVGPFFDLWTSLCKSSICNQSRLA